ncbi:UNVERIFIED_CONTAM: hypothetical protein NCL1_44300 [Trichonephila clavipes]
MLEHIIWNVLYKRKNQMIDNGSMNSCSINFIFPTLVSKLRSHRICLVHLDNLLIQYLIDDEVAVSPFSHGVFVNYIIFIPYFLLKC